MHALSNVLFSCLNVCATAHAKTPKYLAFISKIVNKTFLLIADNFSVENGRYDTSIRNFTNVICTACVVTTFLISVLKWITN